MKQGRPKRYSKYEELLQSLPANGQRRAKYIHGIGIFRGQRGDTVWIKIRIDHPTNFRGQYYARGASIELRLGKLSSWSWEQLEKRYNELQGHANRGELLEQPNAPTFGEWAMEWLDGASNRLRSHSVAKTHIHTQLLPNFGKQRLDFITTRDVNNWISKRLNVARPSTVKRELSTLSSILGTAISSGILSKNCCAETNTITGAVGRQRFLRNEEAVVLLATAESIDPEFADLLLWFIHSGMRKSEVLALTKKDVTLLDDSRAFVHVTRSKSDQARIVTCTTTMIEIFQRQCSRISASDNLFPITAMTLRRRWERIRRLSNLSDLTIHDLRRTHATHAAAAGVDLRTLADRIGHTDLSMLQKHYAAIISSRTFEAASTVETVMKQLTTQKVGSDV